MAGTSRQPASTRPAELADLLSLLALARAWGPGLGRPWPGAGASQGNRLPPPPPVPAGPGPGPPGALGPGLPTPCLAVPPPCS